MRMQSIRFRSFGRAPLCECDITPFCGMNKVLVKASLQRVANGRSRSPLSSSHHARMRLPSTRLHLSTSRIVRALTSANTNKWALPWDLYDLILHIHQETVNRFTSASLVHSVGTYAKTQLPASKPDSKYRIDMGGLSTNRCD